ncbi:MAG: M2 family metallopeptidase [Bacteroidia bacterium]|nr:M2 family metallopeptidase [Bacteroidia bacterium]
MRYFILCILIVVLSGCKTGGNKEAFQKEVQSFLDAYNQQYQKLLTASSETQWTLNTHIVEGDSSAKIASQKAEEAYAAFTGSKSVIEKSRKYLEQKENLLPLQEKQLKAILFIAGNNPETAADVVKKRIAKQNTQIEAMYGFKFMMNGKEVTPNKLDDILRESKDLKERTAAWTACKEVGKPLKNGLVELRDLRNQSVQALGYKDFFDYQASEYNLSTPELRKITQGMISDSWELYRELHTWARYELAKKYNQPVPEYLPADWLPNRWGQDWTAMVNVEGLDIDPFLKKQKPEWITKKGEEFYQSIGFPALPASFWEKSSLYPVPENAGYKKNTHASAWHIDYDKDVRSLMSVETNTEWWGTVLHELGHIYYYMTYSNKDVPVVLRGGANRAYHEALGSMMGLASLQKPFLNGLGMIEGNTTSNDTMMMMKEALDFVVHIPWGSGTMTEFEYQLYSQNLPKDKFNTAWWDLVKKYQGIVPPAARGEEYCDAATKTHINDDAAQYYDYSMSNVLLFQFHDHIAKNILKQDPHATNYWGNKGVGEFLQKIMYPGASVDWREHLKASIGSDFSAKPMMDYFSPLMAYLKKANQGRTYTLPERPELNP